jgi:hypothetical protein
VLSGAGEILASWLVGHVIYMVHFRRLIIGVNVKAQPEAIEVI